MKELFEIPQQRINIYSNFANRRNLNLAQAPKDNVIATNIATTNTPLNNPITNNGNTNFGNPTYGNTTNGSGGNGNTKFDNFPTPPVLEDHIGNLPTPPVGDGGMSGGYDYTTTQDGTIAHTQDANKKSKNNKIIGLDKKVFYGGLVILSIVGVLFFRNKLKTLKLK